MKHYVGQVVSVEDSTEYLIKFLRRKPPGFFFIFPNVDDIGAVPSEDVIKLPQPSQCGGTARINRKFSFGIDLLLTSFPNVN